MNQKEFVVIIFITLIVAAVWVAAEVFRTQPNNTVDESIIKQLRQKSIRPQTQRMQQTRQPDMPGAERKTKEVVIDRAIAPLLKIGDLKRMQEKGNQADNRR